MNKNTILNIATGVVSVAIIYMLVFVGTRDNKLLGGALALFFLLLLMRGRKGKASQ